MSRKWQHICWQAYENNHPTHFFVCNSPHLPTSVQNNVYVHQGCTHGLLAREPLFKIYRYVATFKLFEKWKCGDIDISYRNPSVRNSAFANESGWEKKYLRDSSAPSRIGNVAAATLSPWKGVPLMNPQLQILDGHKPSPGGRPPMVSSFLPFYLFFVSPSLNQ